MEDFQPASETEVAFTDAAIAVKRIRGLAWLMALEVTELDRTRAAFFETGTELLNNTETPFAERFETQQEYFEFLALIGRDRDLDPNEHHDTTTRAVEVLQALHTPDTIAYLQTSVRGKHLPSNVLAIGRVMGIPQPRMLRQAARHNKNDLVLMVQTATTVGEPRESEVGINDIALRYNRRNIAPGSKIPLVVVGAAAVRPLVERAYFGQPRSGKNIEAAYAAMTRGGVRLSELGSPDDQIRDTRQRVIGDLRLAVRGSIPYSHEVIMLPALCKTTREALTVVDEALSHRGPYAVPTAMEQDYNLLRRAVEPDE